LYFNQQIKTMPSFLVQDSVAFVTGTNRSNGIGRAIVDGLIANGASKVYATARDASQLDDMVATHYPKVVPVSLDVTDLDAIAKLSTLYPDVTIVVNNAGYAGFNSSTQDLEVAVTEVQVNYLAPLAIGKSFASIFANLKSDQDQIKPSALVNINSISSFVNHYASGTYGAAKAAAHALTQAQRRDLSNSLVIGVYPGPIDTNMIKHFDIDKPPAGIVANAMLAALANGTEDVFPDPASQAMHTQWRSDPKQLELDIAAEWTNAVEA
jgi:NAD(P)-dependent dehydrogenase (short-subunit alcohol dehydrogenase family)